MYLQVTCKISGNVYIYILNLCFLLAAHCTLNKNNMKVKVGAHNTQDFFEKGAIIKNVAKIINHHEYRQGSGHADISILVLSDGVDFSEFVSFFF